MTLRYKRLVVDRRRAEATMNTFAGQGWRVLAYDERADNTALILLEKESDG